jgi:hypothetical protein
LQERALGVDLEGQGENGVRLVQIYSVRRNFVFLFWLHHDNLLGRNSALRQLFQDAAVFKFHVGDSDIRTLKRDMGLPFVKSFVNLQSVASAVVRDQVPGINGVLPFGANSIAAACCRIRPAVEHCSDFVKDMRQMGTLWDRDLCDGHPKTEQMLDYAAFDAAASYHSAVQLRRLEPSRESLEVMERASRAEVVIFHDFKC